MDKRQGVVRDIRIMVYAKVMRLPMSFFSEERKGDIIARMSGDAVSYTHLFFTKWKNCLPIVSYPVSAKERRVLEKNNCLLYTSRCV